MPISDLLASITGDSPAPSPTTSSRPALPPTKRKAADDLRPAPIKTPRTESGTNGTSRLKEAEPSRPSPRLADKPAAASSDKTGLVRRPSAPPLTSAIRNGATSSSRNGVKPSATTPTSKPLVNRPAKPESAPPQKRSFAEIMARAQASANTRATFGVIQHKTVEKTLTMKERKELKAEEARKGKQNGKQKVPASASKYAGTSGSSKGAASRPVQSTGANSRARSTSSKEKSPPVKEEKKIKKAALATTGYTGTARPRPGAATTKPGAASRPGQRAEERDRSRYAGVLSRPRRNDDFDEELDDFIEYDDEEEEPGYGHGRRQEYYSDEDESDMEAGISDIDEEETRAERLARLEDIKEQELEKRLKREKEERKRRLELESARNARR